MQAMGGGFDREYFPDASKAVLYQKRYERYLILGRFIEYEKK
jgi:L-ribulokinase